MRCTRGGIIVAVERRDNCSLSRAPESYFGIRYRNPRGRRGGGPYFASIKRVSSCRPQSPPTRRCATAPSMSQAGTVLTHRSRVTRSSAFPRHCATDVLGLGLRPPTVFKPAARFPVRQTRYTRLGSSFRSPSIIIIIITRSRRRYVKRRNNGYDDDTPVVYSNHEFGKLQRIIALLLSDVAASCFCSTTYT